MDDRERWDDFWHHRIPREETISLTPFGNRFMDVLLSSLPRCAHRFLEVGSGHGNYSLSLARQWPGREFVALDIAEIAIEQSILRGRRHGITNVAFLCGDARGLPFGDESFDVVFSEGALCYVDDDQKALTEMARVARPGGRLIVAVPNFQNLLHPLYKCVMGAKYQYGWERSYSPAELRRRAVDLGLSQIEVRGFHPAYSLVRLGGALGHLGKILDIMVVQRLDRMTGRRFSDTFGFYIVLIGQKPGGQDCGVPSLKRAMRWAKSP